MSVASPALTAASRVMSDDRRPAVIVYHDFLLPFSETFIKAQAQAMRRHTPVFVGRSRVSGIELDPETVELVDAGGIRGKVESLQYRAGMAPRGFIGRVRRRGPALLHAHFGPDALNARPLQRRLRIPLVVTFHGYDATMSAPFSSGLMQWRYGRRRGLLAERATCIIAVSDFIRERLLAMGMPEEIVRTHHIGVDTNRFRRAPRQERKPVVLAVGRFVEKKGFEYLIDAMSLVERSLPGVSLVLVGHGPLGDQLRLRAERKLQSCIFTGILPATEVVQWMQRARVLAAPSVTARSGDTEGLPLVVMEALASGLPVVATEHAGIPEAVVHGECGFLSKERDVAGLATHLERTLSDDPGWDRLSVNAVARAKREFDLGRQTHLLEDIYSEFT